MERRKQSRAEESITHSTHALVETFGGNTILPLDKWVWTKVGGEIAKKLVSDLQTNDLVLETNTHVSVSLDEIKKALLEDNLHYQLAHEKLYIHPIGSQTEETRLQVYLRHVLAQQGFDAERLKKGEDVGKAAKIVSKRLDEVEGGLRELLGSLKQTRFQRSEQSINKWISGETVLPSNPQVLRALRQFDPAKFDELFGSPKQLRQKKGTPIEQYPLLWAHNHWQTSHSALRNWVAGFSPKALESSATHFEIPDREEMEQEQQEKTRAEGRSLAQERELVYSKLIAPIQQRIDKQWAFIRVKKVEPLSTARRKELQKEADLAPTLTKGIVTTEKTPEEKLTLPKTDYGELHKKDGFIQRIVTAALNKMPAKIGYNQGEALFDILQSVRMQPIKDKEKLMFLTQQNKVITLTGVQVKETAANAMEQMQNGRLDKMNSLPPGTLLKLFDEASTIHKRLPFSEEIGEVTNIEVALAEIGLAREEGKKFDKKEIQTLSKRLIKAIKKVNRYGGFPYADQSSTTWEEHERKVKELTEKIHEGHGEHFSNLMMPPLTKNFARETLLKLDLQPPVVEKLIGLFGSHKLLEERRS